MTMMITKFHRLIQNKTIWFLFSLLVVVSFIMMDANLGSGPNSANDQGVGELDGESISYEEFRQARFSAYLSVLLQVGRSIPYSELQDDIEPLAWQRMIGLSTAEKLGLTATDAELQASLSQQPAFLTNGQFDRDKYRQYVRGNIGSGLGIQLRESDFESHVRQELSLGKLRGMVGQTVLVPPYELKRRYRIYNDIYSADVAIVKREHVYKDITTSGEEAEEFFNQDPSLFTVPPKRTIQYAEFSIQPFMAPDEITEDQIQDYYDRNLEQYVSVLTNEVAATDTNLTEAASNDIQVAETTVVTNSLTEVAEAIRTELAREAARYKAAYAAMDLVDDLTPDRDGSAMSLADAAAKRDIELKQAGPFAAADQATIFGPLAGEVVSQAWQLSRDPNEYFSNPVEHPDSDNVYVLILDEEIDARIPTFDEVRNRVLVTANNQKVADTLAVRAQELADEVEAQSNATNTLASIAEEAGYEVQTLDAINLATGLVGNAYASALVETLDSMSKGEVSDPVQVQDGYLVVQLRDLTPADDTEFASYREQVSDRFGQQITSIVFPSWQEELLRQQNFQPRTFDEDTGAPNETADEDPDAAGGPA